MAAPKQLFGRTADQIAATQFEAPPAGYLPFRQLYNTFFQNSSVANISTKLAELSADSVLTKSDLAFLKNVKAGNGATPLYDYGVSLLRQNGANTDLGWISNSFPGHLTVSEVETEGGRVTHKLFSAQMLPMVFDFPDNDPVNALIPGKKFYMVAWIQPCYDAPALGIEPGDQIGQLLGDRAVAITMSKKIEGNLSLACLGAKVKLAKIGFYFHDKPEEVNYSTLVELHSEAEIYRTLQIQPVISNSRSYKTRLDSFSEAMLTREWWQAQLAGNIDFKKVAKVPKHLSGNEAYSGSWNSEDDVRAFVKTSLGLVPDVLKVGKLLFASTMTGPVTDRLKSSSDLIKAVRLSQPKFKWDGTGKATLEGNFVAL